MVRTIEHYFQYLGKGKVIQLAKPKRMNLREESISELIGQIDGLLQGLRESEKSRETLLNSVSKDYFKSARNLLHYNELRKHDIRGLQKKLRNLGLSRLANSSGHVKASLLNTKYLLESLIGEAPEQPPKSGLSIKNGIKRQNRFAKELLGFRSKSRRVRIMVTQPTDTAEDYEMVLEMVRNGMNCARVNCAHDSPEVWKRIIDNVKKASKELGRNVKIAMDLAGPKIRTGEIKAGPKVRKFSPVRNDLGNVIKPAFIRLIDESLAQVQEEEDFLPLNSQWLSALRKGDKLNLTDTRGKERLLKVVATETDEVLVSCSDTVYVETGTVIYSEHNGSSMVGEQPPVEQSLFLRTGDILTVHREGIGEPATFDEKGAALSNAHISCQMPEIFAGVKKGEPVLFDDGKIEGHIISHTPQAFDVEITRAKEPGAKLKAEKGINFPSSDLSISGLTEKDKEDLRFVVEYADIVNFSFVNTKEDVEELHRELEALSGLGKVGVILKIETQKAYDNLAEILLTAMKMPYVGVMIARGDLAVETGWDKIGWVQKEILGLCNAAHIPVVWATQVFENMAKKGLPSRAEITDATTSLKADCVMLNKGIYINRAISLLNKILSDMERFDEKNESMLPSMGKLIAEQDQ